MRSLAEGKTLNKLNNPDFPNINIILKYSLHRVLTSCLCGNAC